MQINILMWMRMVKRNPQNFPENQGEFPVENRMPCKKTLH